MKKYTQETTVGIFVVICLMFIAYLTINLGELRIFDQEEYTVYARFANISGLRAGGEVQIAGVSVGKVESISLEQDTGVAVCALRIRSDVQLTTDTIASIKTSGLIGDKYIKLSLGGSPDLLKDGDTIVDTESALDIEELISKYAFGEI